jgi:hypothetical protein
VADESYDVIVIGTSQGGRVALVEAGASGPWSPARGRTTRAARRRTGWT